MRSCLVTGSATSGRTMRNILKLALVLFLVLASCGRTPPRYLIPEEKLVPMLVDFHLVYALQQSPDFSDVIEMADSLDPYSNIFEKHGYTKTEFDTTLYWYTRNPEYLEEVYNDVIMRLQQIHDSINPDII